MKRPQLSAAPFHALCALAFAAALFSSPSSGQTPTAKVDSSGVAVLTGTVRDDFDDPLPDAEIVVEPGHRLARADAKGNFRIEAVPNGYNVRFRRLGFEGADYTWVAVAGQGTQVAVRLEALPFGLDTVKVRAVSDRQLTGQAMIVGWVVDSNLRPIPDAELLLVGTGRTALADTGGTFGFFALPEGKYFLRARRMGFQPVSMTVLIGPTEKHEVGLKMTALSHTLKTVEVTEQSGFGSNGVIWKEFDQRVRWGGWNSALISREDLASKGKDPLDWALATTKAATLMYERGGLSSALPSGKVTSIVQGGLQQTRGTAPAESRAGGVPHLSGEQCLLVNGKEPMYWPLNWFRADQVERVEVYPPESDWTGTINARMRSIPQCDADGAMHPTYFVVWLRGN